MAFQFDNYDGAIVLNGFANGVADSPYDGIADMRNCNIISVPGEASVNFSTAQVSPPIISGAITVTGLSSNAISFSGVAGLENGMAIQFTNVGSLSGVSTKTCYWIYSASGSPVTSCKLYSTWSSYSSPSGAVSITGTAGGATFTVFQVGYTGGSQLPPKFSTIDLSGNYWMQDGTGQVWSNTFLSGTGGEGGGAHWTYSGNLQTGTSDSGGQGLAFYQDSKGYGYIFAFLGQSVDYYSFATGAWVWGWNPATDGTNKASYLTLGNHSALFAIDRTFYFCNGSNVSTFFQTSTGTAFDPTNNATYTYSTYGLLPWTDTAQCLAILGTQMLVGGTKNVIYSWDRSSALPTGYIFLAENNVQQMVTVNTNTYALVGNRGRVYVTNGTNAQLYKKVPDHISGTIEPYFIWGGLASLKNQLYYGVEALTNAGVPIPQYGGVWAIDVDTEAQRLTNQLSYGSYAGYASCILPNTGNDPSGTGMYVGWYNGTTCGIDITISKPYTSGVATVDFDLIPIGTFNKTRDLTQIEYKLSRPLVSGESIVLNTRLIFNTQSTGYAQVLSDNTVDNLSNTASVNFQNAQWLQIQAVLTSTASLPSYVRLQQVRILGLEGPTLAQNQILSD